MVCTACYTKYQQYENVFTALITVPINFEQSPQSQRREDRPNQSNNDDDNDDEDEEEEDEDELDEDDEDDDFSNSASHSLLMFHDGSPRIRKGSVTRIDPFIANALDPEDEDSEDSVDREMKQEEERQDTLQAETAKDANTVRKHSLNGHANPVEDADHHNTFQPNQSISYQANYVAKNLEGDIMLQSSSAASNPPSLLQVHQISIGDEGARLTSAAASPEPESPTPSGSGPDKADSSNTSTATTTSSGQKLLAQISDRYMNELDDEMNEQLSSDNGVRQRDMSTMTKSRKEKKQQTSKSHHKKKRKRHSRREFEKAQYKNQENMKFLHFNHININNNFINYPVATHSHGYAFNDIENTIRLQLAVGMLKLYIEQLSIYTQRLKGIKSQDKLRQIEWTEDDVWNAVKQRQSDEQRYMRELAEKDRESQRNIEKQQNEVRHRNIDEICNNIISSDQIRKDDANERTKAIEEDKEKETEIEKEAQRAPTEGTETESENKEEEEHTKKEKEEEEEEEEDNKEAQEMDEEDITHWTPRRKSTFDAMETQLSDEENENGNGNGNDSGRLKVNSKHNLEQILEEEKACIHVGFQEIYESIVAYEYDIKSLCDLILQEMEHNESLHDEIHCYQVSTDDFKHQLKSLQWEYEQVQAELTEKDTELTQRRQKEHELLEWLAKFQSTDEQNQQYIHSLEHQIQRLQHQLERSHNDENQNQNLNQNDKQHASNATGDGLSRLDINTLSEHDLSDLVHQLNDKFFGLQHELKQEDSKLKLRDSRQKQKYEEFLNKHDKHREIEKEKEEEEETPVADNEADEEVDGEPEPEQEDEDEEEEQEVEAEDEQDDDQEDEEEEDGDGDDQLDEEEEEETPVANGGNHGKKWPSLPVLHGNDYESEKARKVLSILTYEKCVMFVEEINAMKKWIKASKHSMRNLKSEFVQKHQYLRLQFSKFNDMRDDLEYQRGVILQQRHRLNTYMKDTERKINEEETDIQRKRFEVEQSSKRLLDLERELDQKQLLLEKEKADFDRMCRRQHQQQIDEELKNAQMLNRRISEIEKKEKEILARTEELETTKKYINKQKELYKRERELIHQQQQQVFFNEKQLQKQQDLISSDQTYIQKEYIDAKESFENDRFILMDKITKLEVEQSELMLQTQSLSNQLKMKQEEEARLSETVERLQKELLLQKQENNKSKQSLFECEQSINKLKQEIALKDSKVSTYEASLKENENKLLQTVQQFSDEKNALQSENKSLKLKIDELNDEIQLLSANKKSKAKSKAKSKSKKTVTSPSTSLSAASKRKLKRNVAVRRDVGNKAISSNLKRQNDKQRVSKYAKSKATIKPKVAPKLKSTTNLDKKVKPKSKAKAATKANAKLRSTKSSANPEKKADVIVTSKLKSKSKLSTKSIV
eukprot:CAMPEP_0197029668 /NCGR_PEP_ID=MMETSP1384-20130603/9064_1 /TAXON_ID=29189 /ORGANISM="Ammonia sp." /LENGTH=1397 /DNA_ID=CAMNT_0042458879 /DNA_START=248 /DNA_END=4441 /DNA_ORIENTATION=-